MEPVKLQSLVQKCWHHNVFPAFFNQYYPAREPHPVSEALAELVEEAVQYLQIMTDEEVDHLILDFPIAAKIFMTPRPLMGTNPAWLERVALNYIMALSQEDYYSIKRVVAEDLRESVVLNAYPELESRMDKNGLLFIEDDFRLFEGGIQYKDHILHYHQFLRRGFRANPNYDFLGQFIRYYYQTKSENRFRIAIDHRRLMPKEYYMHIGEYDAWFGPPFDRSKLDDQNEIGPTVIKRVRPSVFDLLGEKLDRTEFYWSYRQGVKTFEIEELYCDGETFDSYYLNKYVHSERDITLKVLRHFDGAVKVYLKDSYVQRLETCLPNEPKCYKKIKLFRIDGVIDVDEWIELIALFYRQNEMLIEYFSPEQFQLMFGEQLRLFNEGLPDL